MIRQIDCGVTAPFECDKIAGRRCYRSVIRYDGRATAAPFECGKMAGGDGAICV